MATLAVVASVQDRIGALFGVSGVVVLIVAGGLIMWAIDAADKAKASKEKRDNGARQLGATLTGSGHLPASATPTAQTHLCVGGRHNECPGRVLLPASEGGANVPCSCTCHARPATQFCGELSRHDLCAGAVIFGPGDAMPCGCTCHAGRASLPQVIRGG